MNTTKKTETPNTLTFTWSGKGPQWVTRRGMDAVVILAASDYRKITTAKGSLVRFFRESPLVGVELDLTRSKEPAVGEVAG